MSGFRYRYALVALLFAGSAILLYSCKEKSTVEEEPLEMIKTEESENLSIVVSENGRRSYRFTAPLLEGYTLGRDPYREFRKGVNIITYQDDSLSTVNATLEANYAIYYENRKLWEAKGNVKVTKADGTRLYTQQLFWNSITKRIYSNVDTKVETDTDTFIGEGFESDEELNELRFRRLKGKMLVDTDELMNDDSVSTEKRSSSRPEAGTAPAGESRTSGSGKSVARTSGGASAASSEAVSPRPTARPKPVELPAEERPVVKPVDNVRATDAMRPEAVGPARANSGKVESGLVGGNSAAGTKKE